MTELLRRKMTHTLEQWKLTSHKAFLITGARQVGKSFVIREFGKANYSSYIEFNLLINKEARDILTHSLSANDFINRVALLSSTPLVEGDTLIFIDEIQEYPDIVTLAKGLVEDGRYAYAFSGSMLGTEFKGVTSFPVGYVDEYIMRPMDFEEFCWAINIGKEVIDGLHDCLVQEKQVEGYVHDAMIRNFRAYMLCGGMPEVVQNYVDNGYSLTQTRHLQSELVTQYSHDIAKYAGRRGLEVQAIFDRIPLQLEADPHRFNMATLGRGARFDERDHDFIWLVKAGVGLMVSQVTEAKSPLKRTEVFSRFKLYQSDTGMLLSRYPQSTSRAVYLGMKDPNLGGIYENIVAQELAAHDIDLWYYQSHDVGEVDFLMEGASGHIILIEVKSGKKVRSHAALDRLLLVKDYKIRDAIVLSSNNITREDKILYLPFYMVTFIDQLTDSSGGDTFTFAPAVI